MTLYAQKKQLSELLCAKSRVSTTKKNEHSRLTSCDLLSNDPGAVGFGGTQLVRDASMGVIGVVGEAVLGGGSRDGGRMGKAGRKGRQTNGRRVGSTGGVLCCERVGGGEMGVKVSRLRTALNTKKFSPQNIFGESLLSDW